MLINYFNRIKVEHLPGFMYIRRRVLKAPPSSNDWRVNSSPLLSEVSFREGGIEEAIGALQVDFANKFLGGGVLHGGCVQEEIRFAVCPEAYVAMIFCEVMLDNEAIIMTGLEQWCKYKGYGYKMEFDGDYIDPAPKSIDGTTLTSLVAIDAINFSGSRGRAISFQYSEASVLRELNKAYIGFLSPGEDSESSIRDYPAVATVSIFLLFPSD
jgi:poly(ADP-ribose) glycohydrolase